MGSVWQKASYSHEGANCLNVAAAGDGALRLRESDSPGVVLIAAAASFGALIRAAKAGLLPVRGER
ncbi:MULTISPECIES: DUF397 domain-containing protein [Streptomyces]|uniref:DUF397 domain-containing protein n=2 Tax=Streptomyces TaxID=1883 RepID=A0A3Q9FVQ8_STRLT|nr:DUF397 domain-containing protein [Streptomyces luteoverticillatus]AZQ72929.1 DUF397 domain-containing protein [Streptomyces luteoverticillatus]